MFVRARERERTGLSLIPWEVRLMGEWVMAGERVRVKDV